MKLILIVILILLSLISWIHTETYAQDITDPTVTINTPTGTQTGAFNVTVVFSEAVTGFVQDELVATGTANATITTWSPQAGGTDYVATLTPANDGTVVLNVAADVAQDNANNDNTAATEQTVQVLIPETVWMPDANLRAYVRTELGIPDSEALTQAGMAALTQLNARAQLDAADADKISDLTGLEHATQLTMLDLEYNDISDISPLSGLTQLAHLRIAYNDISDISSLEGLTQLTFLDLRVNQISDISALLGLTQLTMLNLNDNDISDISDLSGLTQLEGLDLRVNQISDISALLGLTQLTTLSLQSNQISDIRPLSGLTQLTTLSLGINQISDIRPLSRPLSGLMRLTTLYLNDNDISDISPLSGLTQLTTLSLQSNQISDIRPLSGLTQLTTLSLGINQISDISDLSELAQLTMLNLNYNDISDISPLSGLTQLTQLDLHGSQISDISALEDLTNLTYLGLIGNNIEDLTPLAGLALLEGILLIGNPAVTEFPTVEITVPAAVQGGAFDVRVTFSEVVTDFVQADLSVSGAGATITSWVEETVEKVWTATITPTEDGTVTFNVAAGVAQGKRKAVLRGLYDANTEIEIVISGSDPATRDLLNDPNTAAAVQTVQVDVTRPTVSIDVPSSAQSSAFDVTVEFNESVTGFVRNELVVTGAGATVTAFSGSGTTYTATITPTTDGTVTLSVAAEVAQDAADNKNTAATDQTVEVDMTRPSVSINAPSGGQNSAFTVTVVFTESVTDFAQNELSVSGAGATVTSFSGSGTTYTATVTPTQSGTVTLSVAANVAQDVANNGNTAATTKTVTVDRTRPSVSINVPSDGQNSAFTVIVVFTESVTGFVQNELSVSGAGATVTSFSGSGTTYTATVTPTTEGTVTLSVAAEVAQDAADNKNTAATDQTVEVDMTRPGVSINVPSGGQSSAFTVTVVFTETVTGFAQSELSVNGTAGATVTSFSGSGTTYTATITSTQSGTVTLNVAANVAQDAANNGNTAATTKTVTVDMTRPGVSINVPSGGQNSAFTVTVVFTETVTDFVQNELSVSGAGATVTSFSGSGTTYTATVTPTQSGTVTLSVAANVAQDNASNGNTAATTRTVTVDRTRPGVSINVPTGVQGGVFTVTVVFDEAVTGFEQSELSVSGASATVTSFSGSGTTYTATVTPTQSGTVTLSVAANVAQDNASNGNTAAATKTVTVDRTRPGVSVNVPSGVQSSAFTVTVIFTETVTGFAQSKLSVSGTAGASVTSFSGSGTTYTATITSTQSGTVTLNVAANVAQDNANNGNTAATTKTVTVDRTRPGVSINVPTGVQGGVFTVTVVFDEAVTGFVQSELSVSGASATVTSFSGSGTTYTATVTPTQSGTVTLSVAANVAQDNASNGNTAAATKTVTVDITRPGVSINVPSDGQNSAFTATVVFTETVTGFVQNELSVSGAGATVTSFSGSGTTYTATITPTTEGTVTLSVAAEVAQDAAENKNTAATDQTVEVDMTRPGVSINVPSGGQNSEFTVTVVFTETVTGFVQNELSVSGAGATVTSFSGSGTTYTATITPTTEGTVTLSVAAEVAQDAAENKNTAATDQTVEVDMTRPGVSINVPSDGQNSAFTATVVFTETVTGFVQSELVVSGAGATVTAFSGSGTTYTATITPTTDGTVTLSVAANVASDSANNGNTAAAQTVTVDMTRPGVSINVPSDGQNSAFTATVVFTETVTGFVQNELSVSGAGATVTSFSGSGTTYTATITPTTEGTVTLSVAAEVAQDAANNKNTAATTKTVTVDMTRPSVSINAPSEGQNSAFTVTVVFTETVTGFAQNELSVSGAGATVTSFSGSGTTYTATITPTQSGTVTLSIAANVAQDNANNGNTAATTKTVTVDMTRPSVSINVPSEVQGSAFTATVVFTETVTGFVQNELSVSGAGATVTSFSGSGTTYTATITPTTEGTVTLSVAAEVAQDAAENKNTAATDQTVEVDMTRPSVSINAPSGVQGGVFTVTVVFDEAVTGFVQSELNVSGANATVTSFSGSGTTYTATITSTQSGTVTLNVAANVAQDNANNGNTAATTKTVTVDIMRPGVSINVPTGVQGGVFTVTVVFDEAVTGFVQSELSVSGAGATVTAFSGSGTTYTAIITPTQSGTVTLSVAANVAQDAADNDNTAATTKTVTVDRTRPGVSINVPSEVQGSAFTVTVVFDEAVTGFVQSELSVSGAGATVTAFSGSGTTYTATITPTQSGTVTLSVAANVAQDAADNDNTAATTKTVTVDKTRPGVSINVPTGVQGGVFTVTVVFDEAVTGFVQSELSVSGAGATVTSFSGSGTTYTATVTPTQSGTVTLSVAANVAQDAADNDNTAATTKTVTVDMTRPGVSINVPSEVQGSAFTVTVVFDEAVTGFEQSELSVSGASATVTSFSGSGTTYTATVTPTQSGTVTLSVAANVAQDNASNGNTAAATKTVTVDRTRPGVSVNVPSGVQSSAFTVTVIFTETVTGFAQSKLSVSGTAGASVTSFSGSGTTYTATITPTQSGTVTLSVAANVAQDAADNDNTAATTKTVTVDKTRPGVSINVPTGVQGGVFTVTVVFDEAVTGFMQNELSVSGAGATVTSFSGSGTTYSATITPTQSGTVTLSVAANVASDNANNGNTAAATKTVTVDRTRPGVSINVPSEVQGSAFTVTVVFDEAVTGFVQSELSVSGAGATVTAFSGSGTTYTATITPTQSGTVTLSVAANVASDNANNGNTAAATKTVTVDRTRPGVNINVPSEVQGSAFTVTVVFDEAVTGFVQSELSVSGAGATVTAFSGSGTTYTAIITPTTDGTVTLSVAAEAAQDAADNKNTAATDQTVEVDMTRPGVSINVPSGTQTGAFNVTVVFTETITGFAQSELRVSGADATVTSFSGSGTTYTATITPAQSGTVTLSVAANVAQDNASNGNTAATTKTVTVDKTRPGVSINVSSEVQGGVFTVAVVQSSTFTVTVVFTESVTGFEQSELSVNGTAGATITAWEPQTGGTNYRATIMPIRTGRVTLNVAANVAQDNVGHGNTAAPEKNVSVVTLIDIEPPCPILLIEQEEVTGQFEIGVRFTEPVVGFEPEDIKMTGTLIANITNWQVHDDGARYTATINPTPFRRTAPTIQVHVGTVTIRIYDDVAQDRAGNSSKGVDIRTIFVTFEEAPDLSHPSPAIKAPKGTQTGPFEIKIIFPEPVNGFTQEDIRLHPEGTMITNWVANDDRMNYTATIVPQASGTVSINIRRGVAHDDAGNPSADANGKVVTVVLPEPSPASSLRAHTLEGYIEQLKALKNPDAAVLRLIQKLENRIATLVPQQTTLLPNYPNPFNPETWIPYHLAYASDVQITIYDAQGAVVRLLDLGHQRKGYYTHRSRAAHWDGRNAIGERVASGLYFYQLQADNMSLLRKMVILK